MDFVNPRDRFISDDLCLYRDTLVNTPHFNILNADTTADVCVIGGGLTGVLTAMRLAEDGHDVVLIERHRIGWGASGRTGGQLIPGFNKDIRLLADKYGEENCAQAYRATLAALDECVNTIKSESIACEFMPGVVFPSESRKAQADLEDYAEFVDKHANHKIEIWDKNQTISNLGTDRYRGSMVDMRGGRFNPLQYLVAMAQKAAQKGVRIYEESPATRVDDSEFTGVNVYSTRARVTAKKVVVAGDAYLGWLMPDLRKKVVLTRTSMLATTVLTPDLLAQIIPCNHAVCEWKVLLNYYVKSVDGRMIFGGGDTPLTKTEEEKEAAFKKLNQMMVKTFPQLANVTISHWWGGYISMTMGEVPNVGCKDGKMYYSHGYSGHGIVPSHMVSRLIAEHVKGDPRLMNIMENFRARDIPGAGQYDTAIARLGLAWYRIKDMLG